MSKFLETNGFIGMIGEVDIKKDLVKSLEKIKHRAWKQITIINNKEILNIEDYLEDIKVLVKKEKKNIKNIKYLD